MSRSTFRRYYQYFKAPVKNSHALVGYSIFIIIFTVLLVLPLKDSYRVNIESYQQQEELSKWLLRNQASLKKAKQSYHKKESQQNSADNKRKLMGLVSETAENLGLKLSRLEQHQANVTVTLEKQSLSHTFAWLQELTQDHHVYIEQATLNYADKNRASSILTFSD